MTPLLFFFFLLQDAKAEVPTVRAEIIVVAERGESDKSDAAAAVTLLEREEIEMIPATDLAAVLARVEGFRVAFDRGLGGAPVVSSRGFFGGGEVEYVQLIVDGVPVADTESGLADWRRIRAADLERVEVLRGPGSSLYGDASIGGVIDVVTRHAGNARSASASIEGGSFSSGALDASYNEQLGSYDVGFAVALTRTDGFREHAEGETRGIDLSLRRQVGGGLLGLALSWGTRDRDDPGPLSREQRVEDERQSDPLFRFDRDEGTRERLSGTFHRGAGGFPLHASMYASRRESEVVRTLLLAPGLGDRAKREIDSRSMGLALLSDRSIGFARLRAGVDLSRDGIATRYQSDQGEGLSAEGKGSRRRAAVFVTGEARVGDRLRLGAGARWDELRDSFTGATARSRSAVSPRVGINLQLGSLHTPTALFASYSHAFKAPTLDQRFDPRPFPDFAGGTFRISNPDLEPQTAKNLEVGVARDSRNASFQIVAYRMAVDDEIDFDASTFSYRNIGKSRHGGVELSARFREDRALSPEVSYAWTRVEPLVGEAAGHQLKNIPEQSARGAMTARLGRQVAIRAELRWIGRWFLDDRNDVPVESAIVGDIRVVKRFGRAALRLDLLNVGDEKSSEIGFTLQGFDGRVVPYEFPAAGFGWMLGLEWAF